MSPYPHLISTRELKPENRKKIKESRLTIEDTNFVEIRFIVDESKKNILRKNGVPLVFTSQHAISAIRELIPELKTKEAFAIN